MGRLTMGRTTVQTMQTDVIVEILGHQCAFDVIINFVVDPGGEGSHDDPPVASYVEILSIRRGEPSSCMMREGFISPELVAAMERQIHEELSGDTKPGPCAHMFGEPMVDLSRIIGGLRGGV